MVGGWKFIAIIGNNILVAGSYTSPCSYIKYQSYVNKLISRNIWADDAHMSFNEVSFFRAKLKFDISTQLTLLLQQNLIDDPDVTLEKAYKFAMLAEKMMPKQSSLTAAATVQSYSRNGTSRTCY